MTSRRKLLFGICSILAAASAISVVMAMRITHVENKSQLLPIVIPCVLFVLSCLTLVFDTILSRQGSLIRKRIELVVASLLAFGVAVLVVVMVQMLVFR